LSGERIFRRLCLVLSFVVAGCEGVDASLVDTDEKTEVVTDTGPSPEPLGLAAGVNEYTLEQEINGVAASRYFTVATPPGFSAESSYPVVFVFHGNAAGNLDAEPEKGILNAVSGLVDDDQFVAILPRGYDNCWQLGYEASEATTEEETAFVETLVARLGASDGLNMERVYAMGSSNGAALSHYLAINTTHFSGIATLVSGLDEGQLPGAETPKLSVLQLMNFEDEVIPYEGGSSVTGHTFMHAEDSAAIWAAHNGCNETPLVESSPDRTTMTYSGCAEGAQVMHLGVLPVPWSAECEEKPRPAGVDCGPTHTVDNSYFASDGGVWPFMWAFLNG
jgi:poly(3-hydroxybutyrate) depolymerase